MDKAKTSTMVHYEMMELARECLKKEEKGPSYQVSINVQSENGVLARLFSDLPMVTYGISLGRKHTGDCNSVGHL